MAILSGTVTPDWEEFVACLRRELTPRRVHPIELFLDQEVQEALLREFDLLGGLDASDPYLQEKSTLRLQRFLGYDYVCQSLEGIDLPLHWSTAEDTAAMKRPGGRVFMEEKRGPITSWQEFERYPWPDPKEAGSRALEWYERNLPEDMCIIAMGGFSQFAEHLTWLMGYTTLCYALYDDRGLVRAIADRLLEISAIALGKVLEFERVKVIWASDDMGFKTSTLISPEDLRELVLPGHQRMADLAHTAGRPYLLHSCGRLASIMGDLMDVVRIDGKHSFEDTIEDVREAKRLYGNRIALLGGIDVDFLCRAREEEIRSRVRATLDVCHPGGGYCLGTGNSVANYIPLRSYLVMLDEGRRYRAAC